MITFGFTGVSFWFCSSFSRAIIFITNCLETRERRRVSQQFLTNVLQISMAHRMKITALEAFHYEGVLNMGTSGITQAVEKEKHASYTCWFRVQLRNLAQPYLNSGVQSTPVSLSSSP